MSNVIELPRKYELDHSVASVIQVEDDSTLNKLEDIEKLFSIVFSNLEHLTSWVLNPITNEWNKTEIDYDSDEKQIEEFYTKLECEHANKIGTTTLRFEVYGICYEVDCRVLDNDIEENLNLTLELPDTVRVVKRRGSKRRKNNENSKHFSLYENENEIIFELLEVSINGILIKTQNELSHEMLEIKYKGSSISVQIVRGVDKEYFLGFENSERNKYKFQILYLSIVYPNLRLRNNDFYEQLVSFLNENEYFSNFSNENIEDGIESFVSVWETIDNNSNQSYDLISIDDKTNEINGMSSFSMWAFDSETEYWAFHQLCTKKNPSTYDVTKSLYSWRSEIASSMENIVINGFFRSSSRWLERIYVKFNMLNPKRSKIQSINGYKIKFRDFEGSDVVDDMKLKVSYDERIMRYNFSNEYFFGGVLPTRLNLSGALNTFIFKTKDIDLIKRSVARIFIELQKQKINVDYINVIVDGNVDLPYEKSGSDRYFEIRSDCMFDFMNCVEHSIEVSKRIKR